MSDASRGSDRKPRVLVTRAAGQASALVEELLRLGAEPVSVPLIEIVPPDSFGELDEALAAMANFDWLLFTSANAVHSLAARAKEQGIALNFASLKIAVIGVATAHAVEALNQRVDLVPDTAVAESLAAALVPFARRTDGSPTRFLLVRAQDGREHLPTVLLEAGGKVTIAPVYQSRVPAQSVAALRACFQHEAGPPDGLTLTSSSAARNFFTLLDAAEVHFHETTAIASIGPITSATLRELGHHRKPPCRLLLGQ